MQSRPAWAEKLGKLKESALAALKRLAGQPCFLLGLTACAGILLADFTPRAPDGAWWAVLALAAALFVRLRRAWALHLLCLSVFAVSHRLELADPLRTGLARTVAEGSAMPAVLTGVVKDTPEDEYRPGTWRFPLRVETLDCKPALPGQNAIVFVHLEDVTVPPAYGDRLELRGMLRRPARARNPGEFDYPGWLARTGISAEFEVYGEPRIQLLERDAGSPLMAAALRTREWIGRTVTEDLEGSPMEAATIRAMVLGTRERTPQEVEDAFVASGAMHIFAVSGLHVALFAVILQMLLSLVRMPALLTTVLVIGITFFYVFITGLRPSAWRAAIMISIVLGASHLNRTSRLPNSLGLAALILLALHTNDLFLPGFTLSFGVLIALAAFGPPLMKAARPLWMQDPFLPEQLMRPVQRATRWCRQKLCESLSVSLACTAGSTLLMVPYFNLVTPIGIISNLFLIALSSALLTIACMALLSSWCPWLLWCWNHCNWLLATLSIATAKFFAAVPLGNIRVEPSRILRGAPCEITVLALDDGGAAAHIDTPEGNHWLLDCGGRRHFTRTVRPHLVRSGVNALDGVFLTHHDSGHTGADDLLAPLFRPALALYGPGEIFSLGGRPVQRGDVIPLGGECLAHVLFPPPGWISGPGDDRCVVLRLECRGRRVLFMSDAGFITEKALLESGDDLRADVLVKGRHDSDFSGLPEFLNAVQPQAVVFTNCRFPSTERVSAEWVRRVQAKGIEIFDQDTEGGVIIRMAEGALELRGWFSGRKWRAP